MQKDIKIIVATHKKYDMPKDKMYLPIHAGKEEKESIGYLGDNQGENISYKNPYFCELTVLYWAWKNLKCDYIGLVHYRRYFGLNRKTKNKFENVLKYEEVEKLLKNVDIILPKKRRYYIETLYSHYEHTMYVEPLEETGEIIKELFPNYSKEFERLKSRRSGHMFNMFIMKYDILDSYCKWLFEILFELEKRIDHKQFDDFHSRFYGRISELLLDVYLRTNNIKYREVDFIYMEKINKINKVKSFLKAKFRGKKYDKSF